jgi:hypothetical protein
MKKNALFVILIFFVNLANFAQNSNLQILTTAGDSFIKSDYQLDWTIGELQTETYEGTAITITQGFQQADYKKTATKIENTDINPIYISVFPNPTTDYALINIENIELNGFKLCVTDILGKTLFNSDLTSNCTQINLTNYNEGVYMVVIKQNKKIVKILKTIRI